MSKNIVVIPVYKPSLSLDEELSLIQCVRVLSNHIICVVCPSDMDTTIYESIISYYQVDHYFERFEKKFFQGIAGYNLLMLDVDFYKRFVDYNYMLVYQLDAWVFRDELDMWCKKNYDYIGAPWIKYIDGNYNFYGVGNGGFSLRRIKHFVDVLNYKGPVRKSNQLKLKPSLKNNIYKVLYSLGYQNTISYLKKDPTLYEDIFISIFLSNTKLRAHIPEVEEACLFSFEQSPSYLFSKIKKLPFGCHAWRKFEYDSFWSNYIST